MWVYLNNGFFSIVDHRDQPEMLLVRARAQGDIARVFGIEEQETPGADYRYRAVIPRNAVANILAAEIKRIDYPNFKDSINDLSRYQVYTDVWAATTRLQPEGGRYHWPHHAPRTALDDEMFAETME